MHALALRSCLALLLAAPPDADPPPVQRPSATKTVPRKVNPTTTTPAPAPAPMPDAAPPPDVAPAPAPEPALPPGPDGAAPPEPAPEPAPAPAEPSPYAQPLGDPSAPPPPDPAAPMPVDQGAPMPGPPPGPPPGHPGGGMIVGGIALAGPGLVIGLVGLLAFALTTTAERDPGIPILLGTGVTMLAGGGVLAGFGFRRNIEYGRWAKRTGVRPPRSGHGLIVGGGIAAAAGVSIIAWQADVMRRSPRGEVCTGGEGCQTPRADAALGIGIGALVLGGAGTLLGLGIKQKLKYDAWRHTAIQPSFGLLPGGGTLSLSGRF